MHLMNTDVIPAFEERAVKIETVLSDNDPRSMGALISIPSGASCSLSRSPTARRGLKRPQSNSVVERFHSTLLEEHFRVECRRA